MRKPSGKIYNIGGKKTPLSYSFVDDITDKIDDIATKTTKLENKGRIKRSNQSY